MNSLTNIFKVLSDETRLRIVMLLFQEPLCVCQLSGILNVTQPNISKHLSKLRDLGFVSDERREKFVYYSLDKENKLLIKIISEINNDLEENSQLVNDRAMLSEKDTFLLQCTNCTS